MTDIDNRTEHDLAWEAGANAHKVLGNIRDEDGRMFLETDKGTETLETHEIAVKSNIDALTGLFNRNGWDSETNKYYKNARRNGTPFSIVMMDLDNFKEINDTKGHQEGDHVLRMFGLSVTDRFRAGDICGRYGGDEVSVMLTSGNLSDNLVEEEERNISEDLSQKINVGVSVGIAKWDGESSLDDVIKKADERLYQNKRKRKEKNNA